MKRREFIGLLGGAAAWPLAARAQQSNNPTIGYLSSRTAAAEAEYLRPFKAGLASLGYIENQNLAVEALFANGQYDLQAQVAAEMVRRQPSVIATAGTMAMSLAAKVATATIPIIANVGIDPIQAGLVPSLNHPGGNVTGVYSQAGALLGKNIGLLHDLVPGATRIVVLENSSSSPLVKQAPREAAAVLHLSLRALEVSTESEIDSALATVRERPADAMLVSADPFLATRAAQIASLAARYRIPTIYNRRRFAEAGGLISYGDDVADTFRQFGIYTARVLNGEKPADLPILQTSKFEMVINLKTAKALGLAIPSGILAIADEVIE
jgi:putative ABC transport system substrate-binding protein